MSLAKCYPETPIASGYQTPLLQDFDEEKRKPLPPILPIKDKFRGLTYAMIGFCFANISFFVIKLLQTENPNYTFIEVLLTRAIA